MSRERYYQNRARAYEILGIDPDDPNYDTHHIIFRQDVKTYPSLADFDLDGLANLYILPRWQHDRLHDKVAKLDQPPLIRRQRRHRRRQ